MQRDTIALLLALADKRVTSRRVPDVHVEGTAMPALAVQLSPAGQVTLVFDRVTGLLMQKRYGGEAGEPAT